MLGWINPSDYSFNSFLLLERFQIRMIFQFGGWRVDSAEWKSKMGVALNANPAVRWYFERRCPECAPTVAELAANAPAAPDPMQIREAEVFALAGVEDWITYTTPEVMAEKSDYIRGWSRERLFELADFSGKIVLDVGAGSGRLTFAAAEKAAWVYASEPVETLREFMRGKSKDMNFGNIRVADGFVTAIPYPDNTFDIVMSGHVVGDFWDDEIAELTRVCKSGGWLLDCVGDSVGDIKPKSELTERGFEEIHYVGSFGKDVYNYRKQIVK
ncbi:MAG: class I SAM-dependent methyltransferase [Clostridiales bacterium]|jgi:SAM-dependent methyltransferase|nr:class I SAM-dependent methyltransferase [Clostridiales bacterium]